MLNRYTKMNADGLALVSAVLTGCFVFAITSKRIELQTWDWSCFEDIYEMSMQNCYIESKAAKRLVDTSSDAS